MIGTDKLMKLILVVFVIILVVGLVVKVDINRYLGNIIPDYTIPEHEEIPVENIAGYCGDNWTMVAVNMLGGKIGFCRDEDCSEDNLFISDITSEIVGEERVLYSNLKLLRDDLSIGGVDAKDIFFISDDIFLGIGAEYENVEKTLPPYNDLVNLDGATLNGHFICREGERLDMIEKDRIKIEMARKNICEVDGNNKVISDNTCACMKRGEVDFFGAVNYAELIIVPCNSSKYCYYEERECLEFPRTDLEEGVFEYYKGENEYIVTAIPEELHSRRKGDYFYDLIESKKFILRDEGDYLIFCENSWGFDEPKLALSLYGDIWVNEKYSLMLNKDIEKFDDSYWYIDKGFFSPSQTFIRTNLKISKQYYSKLKDDLK